MPSSTAHSLDASVYVATIAYPLLLADRPGIQGRNIQDAKFVIRITVQRSLPPIGACRGIPITFFLICTAVIAGPSPTIHALFYGLVLFYLDQADLPILEELLNPAGFTATAEHCQNLLPSSLLLLFCRRSQAPGRHELGLAPLLKPRDLCFISLSALGLKFRLEGGLALHARDLPLVLTAWFAGRHGDCRAGRSQAQLRTGCAPRTAGPRRGSTQQTPPAARP
mmetsp:Transcript_74604/g.123672  ORF Transcript_74604/g.123672 Transcript_74604/m.123672 type:complete len:224 (+) Transcript_74604:508-1179(+)